MIAASIPALSIVIIFGSTDSPDDVAKLVADLVKNRSVVLSGAGASGTVIDFSHAGRVELIDTQTWITPKAPGWKTITTNVSMLSKQVV